MNLKAQGNKEGFYRSHCTLAPKHKSRWLITLSPNALDFSKGLLQPNDYHQTQYLADTKPR